MATGRQILELAEKHIGEQYIFGQQIPIDDSDYKGPWDCAEFVSWCVYHATGKLVGYRKAESEAYTGYWKEDMAVKCIQITKKQAKNTPGAIFLRFPGGRDGHISISDGNGGTVEAMNSQRGVTQGKVNFRGWDAFLLIKGVDY